MTQSCHERSWSLFFSSHFCFLWRKLHSSAPYDPGRLQLPELFSAGMGSLPEVHSEEKTSFPSYAAFTCVVWLFSPWTRNFSKGPWVSLGLIQVGAICFPESIFNLRQRIYMWKSGCLPKWKWEGLAEAIRIFIIENQYIWAIDS